MSTVVEIDPQDSATKQVPAYPKQESIPLQAPKRDPPAYEFQPVRMNLMPPAPVQYTPPSKKVRLLTIQML